MYSSGDFGLPSLRLLCYLGMLWGACWRIVIKLYNLAALRGLRHANQEWCLEWDQSRLWWEWQKQQSYLFSRSWRLQSWVPSTEGLRSSCRDKFFSAEKSSPAWHHWWSPQWLWKVVVLLFFPFQVTLGFYILVGERHLWNTSWILCDSMWVCK